MEKEIISANYQNHKIIADIFPAGSTPQVFCMHGAGISNRKLFDPLRQLLAEKNIFSCALDFLGYGETGGDINQSSLKARTKQAEIIIEKAHIVKPLTIIANSMSGYNAIKLTEIYPVGLLILSSPAVYTKESYEIPFGDKFSSIIREPQSWNRTDAWGILNTYKGKIVILAGEKDNVIPFEVTQKIYDNATQASYREIIAIPNAPHKLFSDYFKKHPEDLKVVVDKILTLLVR
ncbi:MAG TPA: alpha/beta hydrolase [Candidatus Paceibacterota bacterium]|jgi:pimeloyl-ACP methyl ester carboxylesterase|nr:alpha/beta hydrolase [Candidatus Paceibacterota bacterium]